MEYNFREIEEKWQEYWEENKTFAAENNSQREKYYVLDMFPYPSGAGLHVGHPLGYIASDIFARYKRHKGFNVLHPMGFDSFGLPAEQYAIITGQHPSITTNDNIFTYKKQLKQLGFSYDWERELRTSDPEYYKWTQWIFLQIFNSWYNKKTDKAEPIESLVAEFEKNGNQHVEAHSDDASSFSAEDWKSFSEKEKQDILMQYRLTYLAESYVNWCPALGTVLANDEIKDGLSERGGYPVERKKMKQWSMRITAYAERLLQGLEKIDWTDALKEIQRNWIGKSTGASIHFKLKDREEDIEVFTTRPDTIFGVSFMVLAPEHELVSKITSAEQKEEVENYIKETAGRSERERMTDVKKVSGVFTGAYAVHPFTEEKIPVWIGDYVLASYGTGAVMAVPSGDQRDWDFAKHFGLPVPPVIEGQNVEEGADDRKNGKLINSGFLDGMQVEEAIQYAIRKIEEVGIGKGKTNYRLRDAVFSRQRYWGEPIPIYYKDGMACAMSEDQLPLKLPQVDKYFPTEEGEPPLARSKEWKTEEGYPIEASTMPGWAGSSWYLFRYMSPNEKNSFANKTALDYWKNVDLYFGGAEHATSHLLYSRFWVKIMFDRGFLEVDEPFEKLINQGMILGSSKFVYRLKNSNTFISHGLLDGNETSALHVDVNLVDNNVLDIEGFRNWREEFKDAEFVLEDGKYICGSEVEKMSKSKYNVVNPDQIVEKYGADTLRMYEMFLGPLELPKPWDTDGIEGVHRFLRKFYRLYQDKDRNFLVSDEAATKEELKALHKCIKKVTEDIERFSFNTGVSSFMICVNELSGLNCNKREILEPLCILIAPYSPHLAEEIWNKLGHDQSISKMAYPVFNEEYLVENTYKYPVSFNGKMRFTLELDLQLSKEEVEKQVLAHDDVRKWLQGKQPKRVIVVPGKIVNVVV